MAASISLVRLKSTDSGYPGTPTGENKDVCRIIGDVGGCVIVPTTIDFTTAANICDTGNFSFWGKASVDSPLLRQKIWKNM